MTTTAYRRRLATAAALLAVAAAGSGCGVSDLLDGEDEETGGSGWREQAAAIEGVVDYAAERPELVTPSHTGDPVAYEVLPPVGGPHFDQWLNCNGEVYGEPVVTENAVHSLEHGAVWITYQPELVPADQVAVLADRVQGEQKLFLSPFRDQDAPISLQAWGYQLQVDGPADQRIDAFIAALRVNPAPEGPTGPCDGGLTG